MIKPTISPAKPIETSTSSDRGEVRSPTRLLLILAAALLCGIAAAVWLDRSYSQSYIGRLDALATSVVAAHGGRIASVLVAEGELAEMGQPLFTLTDDTHARSLADARQRAADLETELAQLTAKAEVDRAWRMKSLESELLDTRLKLAGYLQHKYDHELEEQAWGGYLDEHEFFEGDRLADGSLQPIGHNQSVSRKDRTQALLKQEAARNAQQVVALQIAYCERRLEELADLKQKLPEKLDRALGIDRVSDHLSKTRAEVERIAALSSVHTIVSPAFGTVGVLRHGAGDKLVAGDAIVDVLDEDRRSITVAVPTSDVPFFQAGDLVALEFPGGIERQGLIRDIPPQTAGTPNEGDAKVVLHIDPVEKLWPRVPVGTSVEVCVKK